MLSATIMPMLLNELMKESHQVEALKGRARVS